MKALMLILITIKLMIKILKGIGERKSDPKDSDSEDLPS